MGRFANSFRTILCALFLGSGLPAASDASNAPPRRDSGTHVLILHSYHAGYPFTEAEQKGIASVLATAPTPIETHLAYLDAKRVKHPDYLAALQQLYKIRYANVGFSFILATDNDALEFLLKYRDSTFPGVPVFFCGINDFDPAMLAGQTQFTGVIEDTDYLDTMRTGLNLCPRARKIVAITDGTTTGRAHIHALERLRPELVGKAELHTLSLADLTMEGLTLCLRALPNDSIVLLLSHYQDRTGRNYSHAESMRLIAEATRVPLFVVNETRLGFGAVGGKVISGQAQGKAAADMLLRHLAGTPMSALPVVLESPNVYMFDHAALVRFGMNEARLPQGSVILNRPVSFYSQHKLLLVSTLIVFAILVALILLLSINVARRKRSEAALRESEEKYRTLFDSAGDAIFIHNAERMLAVNPLACEQLGYTPAELMAMPPSGVDTPEQSKFMPERFVRLMEQGHLTFETEHQHKDGSRVPTEATSRIITWGGQSAIMSICRDITERKQAEAQMLLLTQNLEQKNLEMEDTLYAASHDLRSPLLNVRGFSNSVSEACERIRERLRGEDVPPSLLGDLEPMLGEQLPTALHFIQTGGQKLDALINGLLVVSRAGRQELRLEAVNMIGLVAQVLSAMAFQLQEGGASVEIGDLPPCLGDGPALNRVFANLLDNALKYRHPDRAPHIRVSGRVTGGRCIYTVEDNGIGIETRHQTRIWKLFHRLDPNGPIKGEGLGLTLVLRILNRLRGRAWVESQPEAGTGCCFYIELPASLA